jgi:hypothetical protein
MRRVALLLCALLGATVLPFAPGNDSSVSAAPSDIVAVVVDGTGFGHGRGMSQWGAYGWAVDQGKTWQWILDHYYGGTTLGDVDTAQARIRVRLLGLDDLTTVGVTVGSGNVSGGGVTARSLHAVETSANRFDIYRSDSVACPTTAQLVVPDGPIQLGSTNSTAVRQIQTFLNAFRTSGDITLTVDGDFGPLTQTRLRDWQADQNLTVDGIWNADDAARARQQIAGASDPANWTLVRTVTGPVTFTSANGENSAAAPSSVLGVCDAGGKVTHYRGKIEVRSESDGNRVVNDVKTEDYLRGVVPKEISASWADAGGGKGANAVRAQAVAARSYALQQNRYGYASICDTQSCQVYFGSASRASATASAVAVEDPRTDAAIVATAGKVRKFANGQVASTEFSASNGPRTAGGVFPAVDDVAGDGTSRNPNHRWTRILDADALASQYGLGRLTSATMVEAASAANRQFDGIWFNDVVLTGSNGKRVQIPAWDFRGSNGLPSPGFTLRTVTRDTRPTSMAMIGNSVGNSIAGSSTSELRTLVDGTFASTRFDVVNSRCTTNPSCPGTSGVEAAAALPFALDLVVVELGYNDLPTTFASSIDAMMAALQRRGVREVAWVNMADIRTANGQSVYGPANAALQAARSRWPNLTVLDWNAASAGPERPRWFSDGVHLTATGQAKFALWLREAMVTSIDTRLAPPRRIEVQVTGRSVRGPDGTVTTIPNGVSAASFNVTAVGPDASGFVTVWPCSVARPLASTLNYSRGAIDANGVIAPVDANGKACLYSHVETDLLVDITGWFGPGTTGGSGFQAITPRRLVDSRNGTGVPAGRIRPEAPIRIQVTGAGVQTIGGAATTVPTNAVAAAINVTSVSSPGAGYITVWPCGVDRPVVSTLNFSAGAIRANGAIAALGTGGTLCLYSHSPTDVVVDIVGWFTAGATPSTSAFVSPVPARWVDTREGLGAPKRPVAPARPIEIPVTGRQMNVGGKLVTIPADAEAVSLNIVSVDAPTGGFATVWPCGAARPTTSNLNYPGRSVVANNVIATIGVSGSVCLYTHSDSHVVVDVTGWLTRGDAYSAAVPDRAVDTRFGIGPGPV